MFNGSLDYFGLVHGPFPDNHYQGIDVDEVVNHKED
jgi:hypothetical protein